jgi:NTE family protein
MLVSDDRSPLRSDLALAVGGVGWSALACLPLLAWLDAKRVRPAMLASTGLATLPAALWSLGMPARDIAHCLAEHLPNEVFRQRDPLTLLSMIGLPLRDRGLSHALWRSRPLMEACRRLFGDARLEAMPVPLRITLVDCLSGQFHSIAKGDLAALAYASTALLPALPPLRIDSHWMCDASVYHAAPLNDLLLRPGLRHVITSTCSFPPRERYTSLVDQQLTLQVVLQKAALKTSALLALDLMDGEVIVLAARLQRPVDPFDVTIVPEVIAAGEWELAQSDEHISVLLQGAPI